MWVGVVAVELSGDSRCHPANSPESPPPHTTHFVRRRGTKYSNLHAVLHSYPELLDAYDYVFAVDDDIEVDTVSLNQLFHIVGM